MLLFTKAQNKLKFTYDPITGSQITRELCFGCPNVSKPSKDIKEIEAVTEEDLQKFSPEDMISYYPNPVREELYLKWEVIDQNTISSIQVYSLTGQVLRNYTENTVSNSINIPFQDYANGVYLVQLNYVKGDQKTIKIIKQ
ncbi:T9SS type A sorting domain-containing protein [Flavobacterium humi]|uniref:T9SS type A sorting domain-containing protein n=2 Tax=Flavobacterium humi TaxID=2562683 RepID=A0A4Z0LBP1_9FLAO|nr:T9SS type A sorting domain-containing protein [Flavobacterium humi]